MQKVHCLMLSQFLFSFIPVVYCSVDWRREFTFTLNLSVSLSVSKWIKFFICEAVKNLLTCSLLSLTGDPEVNMGRASKSGWEWQWSNPVGLSGPARHCGGGERHEEDWWMQQSPVIVISEKQWNWRNTRASVIPVGIGTPRASGLSRSQVKHYKNPTWVST